MTDPLKRWNIDSTISSAEVRAEVAHRAALAIVARYPDDPVVARHLLEMLGLLDVVRASPRATATAAPADPATAEPAIALVDTEAAAEALHTTSTSLHRFARARIVAPARVDPDGSRWWNLPELRNQLASYLHGADNEKPTFG